MKLAYLGTVYRGYADLVAARAAGAPGRSFASWREELEGDAYGWVGAWGPALAPLGWEFLEVQHNVAPLQRAWAREQGLAADASPDDVALAQVERFRPELLWYDHHDAALLGRLRERCRSLRAVVGWAGSVPPDTALTRGCDLTLSCARETVAALERGGTRAAHLDHAFNERVLESLPPRAPTLDVSFVGQIAADHPLHEHRERLLEALLAERPVAVFSPTAETPAPMAAAVGPRRVLYAAAQALRRTGMDEEALRR
ncbi:MAG TPA: hypothetical protein VJY35_13275, partial [Candidatus Eisenbacteria bacterium]|nr:hypothetical protein [Candidatus Eisenbacteria bacterium]